MVPKTPPLASIPAVRNRCYLLVTFADVWHARAADIFKGRTGRDSFQHRCNYWYWLSLPRCLPRLPLLFTRLPPAIYHGSPPSPRWVSTCRPAADQQTYGQVAGTSILTPRCCFARDQRTRTVAVTSVLATDGSGSGRRTTTTTTSLHTTANGFHTALHNSFSITCAASIYALWLCGAAQPDVRFPICYS